MGFAITTRGILPLLGRPQGRARPGAARVLPGVPARGRVCRFDKLYAPTTPSGDPALIEVACWSHARRKFYDVHQATASPIAFEALEQIAALFAIEAALRARAPDDRVAARQEHARPRLDGLRTFLDT